MKLRMAQILAAVSIAMTQGAEAEAKQAGDPAMKAAAMWSRGSSWGYDARGGNLKVGSKTRKRADQR